MGIPAEEVPDRKTSPLLCCLSCPRMDKGACIGRLLLAPDVAHPSTPHRLERAQLTRTAFDLAKLLPLAVYLVRPPCCPLWTRPKPACRQRSSRLAPEPLG